MHLYLAKRLLFICISPKRVLLLFICFALFPVSLSAQKNKAEIPVSIQIKPKRLVKLPSLVGETSGLLLFDGLLWTINDSDNPAILFGLDTISGEIVRTVAVRNSTNTDWEAVTQDESNIYIGDFGNNLGNRTDLRILKISKATLLNPDTYTVDAGSIRFRYPDQASFETAYNSNNFDCEAFVYYQDSLHLFSKNWIDLNTRHYVLPADTGTHIAKLAGQFNADGLITDASVNKSGNLVLLGYKHIRGKKWKCFCWLTKIDSADVSSGSNKIRISLGTAFHLGQTEGIFLTNDNRAWISSESIVAGKLKRRAKLFSLDLKQACRHQEAGAYKNDYYKP